jgi:hypothetical protein
MGETINGALRLHNHRKLTDDEMVELQRLFNELNQNSVPRPGQVLMIPILCQKNPTSI